jgi:hypothetical protein
MSKSKSSRLVLHAGDQVDQNVISIFTDYYRSSFIQPNLGEEGSFVIPLQ